LFGIAHKSSKEKNMNRHAWVGALAGLAFSALAQAAPFAMITDLKGDAWASEFGKQKKLALLSYIEAPVEVKVEPSTTLGVTYFTSGVQYSFQGPARVALGAQAPRVIDGQPALSTKLGPEKAIEGGLSKDQWRRLQQATVVMRTVKPTFAVVSPDKSVLLTREPEFEWTAAGEAKRFRLVVYGPDNKILHEATTDQTALQPGSALKLEPGQTYRWKVEVLGVTTPGRAIGTFTTENEALRTKMIASRPGVGAPLAARMFYATILEAEGYMADARAEWKVLSREYPDVPEIKQRGL
jgi:hypothetical protein